MSYKTVCVAGGGVLGSQIAFQAAYCGFDVTIWLRSEGSIGRTQPKIDHVREEYIAAIEGMADGTGEWCSGIADSGKPFDKEEALAAVERLFHDQVGARSCQGRGRCRPGHRIYGRGHPGKD